MSDPYARFDRLKNVTVVSGLTLTFGAARYFEDQVPKSVDQIISTVLLLAYALVPLLIWLFVTYMVIPLIQEKRSFRQLVLGRRYVEGTWVEWVRGGPHSGDAVAIIEIQPDMEGFTLSGFNNDEHGLILHAFRATLTKFEWPYLHYAYDSSPGADSAKGIGILQFSSQRAGHNGAPTYFTGEFAPGGDSISFRVVGKRLSDQECEKLTNENERRMLIERYFADFAARGAPKGPERGPESAAVA